MAFCCAEQNKLNPQTAIRQAEKTTDRISVHITGSYMPGVGVRNMCRKERDGDEEKGSERQNSRGKERI